MSSLCSYSVSSGNQLLVFVADEDLKLQMQILCDKDPSVMSAALCALFDLVTSDVKAYKNLTTSFVSILKQVAEHRLPKTFDYHRTPAPFVQVLNQLATRNQECFFNQGR